MNFLENDPPTLKVQNLAQIKEGEVTFGDFTLLVGPQASGKSIFLQTLKFEIDRENIAATLKINGYDWSDDEAKLLALVFGEGMGQIVRQETKVSFKGGSEVSDLKQGKQKRQEQLFYVIAQRVLTMQSGWPRSFGSYEIGDPFVMKAFSETLRLLMEKEGNLNGKTSVDVFPKKGRIAEPIRNLIDRGIFFGSSVELDNSTLKKRFLLNVADSKLPYMTWSAGQKEFMPLLLSFYHLMPPGKVTKRDSLKWVVIEEPEMGLHPQAIQSLMVIFLELIHRGYKLVISTHSSVLLELAWAMRFIQSHAGTSQDLFDLFGMHKNAGLDKTFKSVVESKTFNTFYFDRQVDGVHIKDISSLDPGSEDGSVSNWGGLSDFASRASEVVAKLSANEQ